MEGSRDPHIGRHTWEDTPGPPEEADTWNAHGADDERPGEPAWAASEDSPERGPADEMPDEGDGWETAADSEESLLGPGGSDADEAGETGWDEADETGWGEPGETGWDAPENTEWTAPSEPGEWASDEPAPEDSTGSPDDPDTQQARRSHRVGPGRLITQTALAGVAVLLLVALAYILSRTSAQVADGPLGWWGQNTWTAVLITLLAIILIVEILLLDPVYRRLFHRIPRGLPAPPDEDAYVVGCPGCGTVFTVTPEEIEAGSFSCHNCGRAGVVKDETLSRANIQRETCRSCGNTYFEYLEYSECPVCHEYNEY